MSRIVDPYFAERVSASFARQNAVKDDHETLCALIQQTIMVMLGKTEK